MLECDNTVNSYIHNVAEKLKKYFDIQRNVIVCNIPFELYAYHRNDFFKSFITKSTVYEGFSVFEHILVYSLPHADESVVFDFQNKLIDITSNVVNPDRFHKKTTVIGILLIKDSVDESLIKHAKKFFCRKTYRFSFRGWSETQMAIVSIKDKKVYYPKHSKDLSMLLGF